MSWAAGAPAGSHRRELLRESRLTRPVKGRRQVRRLEWVKLQVEEHGPTVRELDVERVQPLLRADGAEARVDRRGAVRLELPRHPPTLLQRERPLPCRRRRAGRVQQREQRDTVDLLRPGIWHGRGDRQPGGRQIVVADDCGRRDILDSILSVLR